MSWWATCRLLGQPLMLYNNSEGNRIVVAPMIQIIFICVSILPCSGLVFDRERSGIHNHSGHLSVSVAPEQNGFRSNIENYLSIYTMTSMFVCDSILIVLRALSLHSYVQNHLALSYPG
jgi:hypothetical protein